MNSKTVMFWLAVLLVFSGGMTLWFVNQQRQQAADVPSGGHAVAESAATSPTVGPPISVYDFSLVDQNGQPFESDQMRGKVWVASFFFSRCPQVCRLQNQQVAKLQQAFGSDGVHFVSITCDPAFDTPAVLDGYAQMFNAQLDKWHFLSGDFEMIKRIGAGMKIVVQTQMHSDRLIVIDRTGAVRNSFRSTVPEQFADLETLLRKLLQEEPAS